MLFSIINGNPENRYLKLVKKSKADITMKESLLEQANISKGIALGVIGYSTLTDFTDK